MKIRIQIQKEAQVLADNPDSEFFGQLTKIKCFSKEKNIWCTVYAR